MEPKPTQDYQSHNVLIKRVGAGRALTVTSDGTFYRSISNTIYRSVDSGNSWQPVFYIPCSFKRRLAQVSRLTCRLLRHEVKSLLINGNSAVACNKEGIFYARAGNYRMKASKIFDVGVPFKSPMCLTAGSGGRIVWGEYFSNPDRREIRIFVSDDDGRTFDVASVISQSTIRHIHNIVYDQKKNHYWLLSGDFGEEAGIGILSTDFKHFDWLVRGKQCFRAVNLFDFGDYLIYGTDTELEQNKIMRIEKKTGRFETIMTLRGSCLHGCRFGELYVLSTTVEPAHKSCQPYADLVASRDGIIWQTLYTACKDRWNGIFFQYGSLVLPRNCASEKEIVFFSGQALIDIDNIVCTAAFSERP